MYYLDTGGYIFVWTTFAKQISHCITKLHIPGLLARPCHNVDNYKSNRNAAALVIINIMSGCRILFSDIGKDNAAAFVKENLVNSHDL